MSTDREPSRRRFLRGAAGAVVAGAAIGRMSGITVLAQAETKRTFKVALLGCGGRGRGALRDHMEGAKHLNDKLGWNLEIQVVATADWYAEKAQSAGQPYGVPPERCFGGADAYRKAIAAGPDIVLMAAPPAFRPPHFEAAIAAGKHVFFEKPVAVDPVGVRRVLAAGEQARQKGLGVVAGTQRRHEEGRNRLARELREGARGRVLGGRVSWCQGHIFSKTPINPQGPGDLTGEGWKVFVEMSGDHIVEQHVHNIDVANWVLDAHPISAVGFGGRARRPAGNMYDFFSVDFEYPSLVHIHSMCRQMAGCSNWTGEEFVYEKPLPEGYQPQTPDPYAEPGYAKGPQVSEHAHLLHAVVKGIQLNEAHNVAWSTATAIMGRESAYTGQKIMWEDMFESPAKKPEQYNLQLKPTADDFETAQVVIPKEGEIRIPGVLAT